jgi:peptide deformylase
MKSMSLYYLQHGKSEFLRMPCQKVEDFSRLDMLLSSMEFALHFHHRNSITAPQLGEPYQLILAKINGGEKVIANPKIVNRKGYCVRLEHCVNLSSIHLPKLRSKEIILEYQDRSGLQQQEAFSGPAALYLQHSMDHLKGKLLFNYF